MPFRFFAIQYFAAAALMPPPFFAMATIAMVFSIFLFYFVALLLLFTRLRRDYCRAILLRYFADVIIFAYIFVVVAACRH